MTIIILVYALNVRWCHPLRLRTQEEAALWMEEVAGYHFRHNTFEMSVEHPSGAVLQDSEREIFTRDTNLGIINS